MEEDKVQRIIEAMRASINNQKKLIELVTAQSDYIKDSINAQAESIAMQEETIQKQHENIAMFQNDMLLKTQKGLILELIGIADNIAAMLDKQADTPGYDSLLQDVRDLAVWVDNSLKTAAVRSFSDVTANPRAFNPKRQELKEHTTTQNKDDDGKLVSVNKGYVWTMPWVIVNSDTQLHNMLRENPEARMFNFIIRPEIVNKLVFDDHNDDTKAQETQPDTTVTTENADTEVQQEPDGGTFFM